MSSNSLNKNRVGVFITGATGFVGSSLTMRLLLEEKYNLFCLVRPNNGDPAERLQRTILSAAKMSGLFEKVKEKIHELNVIPGDLKQSYLGISEPIISDLKSSGIFHFWHCAAYLKFEEAYREIVFRNNVEGTKNAVDTARLLNVSDFNYISTAFVAGERTGIIPESYHDKHYRANNPYEESKRIGEDIVLKAGKDGDFYVRIFRPSIIIGHSETYETTSDFSFYGFVAALDRFFEWVKGRIPKYFDDYPMQIYRANGTTLNMIPVDILVDEALSLCETKNTSPEFHHLTNPYPTDIDSLPDAWLDLFPKIKIEMVGDLNVLRPLDSIFRNKLSFYSPYLMNDKQFERNNDIDHYYNRLDFSKLQLKNYTEKFLHRWQSLRKENEITTESILDNLHKKSFKCRLQKTLSYYQIGKGEVIVLVNAYGISLQAWKDIISHFSNKYRVITWECRGLWNSHYPADPNFVFSAIEHSRDLLEILNKEKIDKANIIAWCTGSKPALKFYSDNPDRVKSLTFIAGNFTPLDDCEEVYTKWSQNMRSLTKNLETKPALAKLYMRTIAKVFSNETDTAEEEVESRIVNLIGRVSPKYQSMILSPFLSEESIRNYSKMIRSYLYYNISDILDQVDVPVFVVSAENDELVNALPADIVSQKICGSKRLILPASSHWLIMESGDEVSQELENFIELVEESKTKKWLAN